MPTQLKSGRWAAYRRTDAATEVRIFDTEAEAEDFERD